MNVSRQRLSKCNQKLDKARPWLGQSGKLRKRQTVRKPRLQAQGRVTAGNVLSGGHTPSKLNM